MSAVEAVACALASRRPYHRHGQRCPVWTDRPSDVHGLSDRTPTGAELGDCNCWIMTNAREDAVGALDALSSTLDHTGLARDRQVATAALHMAAGIAKRIAGGEEVYDDLCRAADRMAAGELKVPDGHT